MIRYPIIKDCEGDFSGKCCPAGGLKELHRIPRTLPGRRLLNEDPEVLQDEAAEPILDETTNSFIYDTLVAGGNFEA